MKGDQHYEGEHRYSRNAKVCPVHTRRIILGV